MAREIPEVVRAAAGLAATVLDEARKLPETLPGLPVRLIGLAMQKAMWVQQQYSGLVARGDEVFTGIRGEQEPGLATFDEDLESPAATSDGGFPRDSAFDRAGGDAAVSVVEVTELELADEVEGAEAALETLAIEDLVDDEASGLPADPAPEAAVAAVEAITEQVQGADAAKTPSEAEVLASSDVPSDPAGSPVGEQAGAPDVGTGVDVLTADDEVETVDAAVTDEGIAAPEAGAGATAPATAPVHGYDDYSIAQLRGRLRGYAPKTVQELLDYEEATRAREPYLRMLRNRLERLEGATA